MKNLINLNRHNLWTAVGDYRRHTCETNVLDDISDSFVDRLAKDSAYAKRNLRSLFMLSDGWNHDLQAIVINGTKTHNPDFSLLRSLAYKILNPATVNFDLEKRALVDKAVSFFVLHDLNYSDCISAIQELAPRAYAPNKKPSRIFRALCDALGVSDESKGSQFQRLFAQFADELNGRQLDFKLFVSINPAHFLTMSNPKHDNRGSMLTSCHSFNVTDYDYNNGCSGYARDDVSFIVFTAADPDNPETLNNRKTTRQIFAYKPFNGLLLQSRLYETNGGTRGHQADSDLYRNLIQREISKLEEIPNLWHTEKYCGNKHHVYFETGSGFGGYPDWTFSDFNAKISIHDHHLGDYETFNIGTYGLCICCGEEISEKLYCEYCDENAEVCDVCGNRCDGTTRAINQYGEYVNVCETCLEEDFCYCCHCDDYHHRYNMTLVGGTYVCSNCLEEYYHECSECGELRHRDNTLYAFNQYGDEVIICENCRDYYYEWCQHCDECCHDYTMHSVNGRRNQEIRVCNDCLSNHYSECEHCGAFFHNDDIIDGLCPDCRQQQEVDAQ